MDSGPKLEPSFDPLKSDAGSAAAAPQDVGAPASPSPAAQDKGQDAEKPQEKTRAKAPPIPSSALVVLPPSKARFEAEEVASRPKRKGGFMRFATRAALVLILCGAAFAAGGRFLGSAPFAFRAGDPTTAAWQLAKGNSDATTKALSEEMHGIEARLDSLRADESSGEILALKRSVDALKASFEAQKAEANASIAALSAKLDQLQREPRVTQTALERPERSQASVAGAEQDIDPKAIQSTLDKAAHGERPITTAAIPASGEPQDIEPASPRVQTALEPQKKPLVLSNWVVRDVYDGIALVEGPEGALEVMPGDYLPGAGVVKSIERRGGGWILLTSRGMVEYAGD